MICQTCKDARAAELEETRRTLRKLTPEQRERYIAEVRELRRQLGGETPHSG